MSGGPRARDLGIGFDGEPGPCNAITDVPGVLVGYTTLVAGDGPLVVGQGPVRTGVTAIVPRGRATAPAPVWAGHFNLNGNGELTGTHWVHDAGYFLGPVMLTNTHSVGMVHHAAVRWMIGQYGAAFTEGHAWAMPLVGETYDGLTSDICGQHVTEAHALAALAAASDGPLAEGNVGGGTGMQTYEFKGGTGTASRCIRVAGEAFRVGVLVQSNFGTRHEFMVRGVPVGRLWPEDAPLTALGQPDTGSIIVVIATDAPLSPLQLQRLARRGALGIGRTGTSGGHYSGDIMLAFSVANELFPPGLTAPVQPLAFDFTHLNDHHADVVYEAAVQAVEEAILNAMVAARSLPIIKPSGYSLKAIDHQHLLRILREYRHLPQALG